MLLRALSRSMDPGFLSVSVEGGSGATPPETVAQLGELKHCVAWILEPPWEWHQTLQPEPS